MKAQRLENGTISFEIEEGDDPEIIELDQVRPFVLAFAKLVDMTGNFFLAPNYDSHGNVLGYDLERHQDKAANVAGIHDAQNLCLVPEYQTEAAG